MTIALEDAATLIDLDGTAPLISTVGECVRHYRMLTPAAKADARILLTAPTARVGRRTRTWILNPAEIELLAIDMAAG